MADDAEYIECCEVCGAEIAADEAEHDIYGTPFCGPCWEGRPDEDEDEGS